jgi:hypothetical protein
MGRHGTLSPTAWGRILTGLAPVGEPYPGRRHLDPNWTQRVAWRPGQPAQQLRKLLDLLVLFPMPR